MLNDTSPKNQEFDYQTMKNQPEAQWGCIKLNPTPPPPPPQKKKKREKNMSIKGMHPKSPASIPKPTITSIT
jgi:hypothetical protein